MINFCFSVQPGVNKAEKFDYVSYTVILSLSYVFLQNNGVFDISFSISCQVMEFVKKMTGREYVGFSNAT